MASKAVNVPTNKALKERDINHKLQLYGIYSAFNNGKVPSNKQIDVALNSLLESKALSSPSSRLSPEGHTLIQDLRNVIFNAKQLILVKNEGNLIQEFIWDAEHSTTEPTETPGAPVEKDTARQHGQQALEGLKTLGTLLVTNGQFRKLLRDATLLLREMSSDAAQRAVTHIKPSDEELSQIDRPAEENVWHEKPDFSNIKGQAKSKYDKNKPADRGDVTDATSAAVDTAGPSDQGQGAQTTEGMAAGAQALRDRASKNVPKETKERTGEISEKTRAFLAEKMPQERREQVIWRLKKMIVEIQGHPDYQRAIETLLSLAETYGGRGRDVSERGGGAATELLDANRPALTKLKTLIERFANCTSIDDLFDSIKQIYRDADNDPRLKKWFEEFNTFIRKCLQEQGYVLEDSSNDQWNYLYDEGLYLLRERYREHTNRVVEEIKFLADQFDQDPLNKAFGDSMQQLFHDLGYDVDGKIAFKRHLMKDVTSVIMPAVFESIRYVPIPRIEVSDEMVDVVIENLVIESDNLMPNAVEFGSDNYWRWGRKQVSTKRDNKVMISASGIQTDWRDISYYIKKKEGFTVTDKGVMDILMGGEGFSFRIMGRNSEGPNEKYFIKPEHVSVEVHNLGIKLKKSKHKLLFTLFKPLLFNLVRPAVEKALEKQIRDSFVKADGMAYKMHSEAIRARETARHDPEQAKGLYSYYVDAARRQMFEMKKKKEGVEKRDTKVNVAVTQHDSIFPGIQLPGGISTKATEYKELAAKGNRWASPVFGIGSAPETTGVPKPRRITRKAHAIKPPAPRETASRETAPRETAPRETAPRETAYRETAPRETGGAAARSEETRAPVSILKPSHKRESVDSGFAQDIYDGNGTKKSHFPHVTHGTKAMPSTQTIPGTRAPIA
ncbi:hypothetical protein AJ80_05895 [Polytolypa hystricis UAMH7299]|uniref:Uncharacterized protein n=1 Tax=Polytolypa hystricis (strain UAMH7299) TaxID=1447883 RepID=A0A2B7XZJ9_POLH7|nr:hypothetical protein AJ80_05895 [Polytolypa hystricis UAMH7299]